MTSVDEHNALDGAPGEVWHDRGYADDMRNDVICPRESCGHRGKDHDPDSGCLVEQYGEYCSCPLAPIGPWTEERWPIAYKQRDIAGIIWEDEE